jgi:hypothetical protein
MSPFILTFVNFNGHHGAHSELFRECYAEISGEMYDKGLRDEALDKAIVAALPRALAQRLDEVPPTPRGIELVRHARRTGRAACRGA